MYRVAGWPWSRATSSTCTSSGPFTSAFSISVIHCWVARSRCLPTTPHPCHTSAAGRDVLSCPEPQSQAPPSLGGDHGGHFGAPVHHGGPECGGGFSEPSGPDHRLRMDLVSGGGRRVGEELAGGRRSFCHLPQLLASRVFLPLERSDVSGDGCVPSILGRAPGLHVSTFSSDPQCAAQASVLQGYSPHLGGSSLA